MLRLRMALGLGLAVFLRAGVRAALEPLPAEALFRTADIQEAQLSADGQHLAALVADPNGRYNLLTYDLKTLKPTGLRASGDFEVSHFEWFGNDGVLFNIVRRKLYSVGLFSSKLAAFDRFRELDRNDVTQIIGIPRKRPGRVIVWITQSSLDFGRPGELLELDANLWGGDHTRTGAIGNMIRGEYQPPKDGPVIGWECDRDGELALCTTWLNGSYHLHRYQPGSKSWKEVPLPPSDRPMALDYDARFLWIARISSNNAYELCRLNLNTGVAEDAVLTDPTYDIGVGRLYFSDASRRLVGVGYMRKTPYAAWFNGTYAAAQATLNKLRPSTYNVLIDHDAADRRFLFSLGGPIHPHTYELLDTEAKTLRNVSDEPVLMGDDRLTPVQSVSFMTRDGIRLEGYQSMPKTASTDHPVPLVVLVHGGPWVRDDCEFNPIVQFLASRGYAVLQPNYRGSAGYSPAVSHEGRFDYFRMHQDVTDATRAILGTGRIDRSRVAIMGSSFGGYLAVSGVAFDDGLYRCAVSECGVFDWAQHIKSKRDIARPGEYEVLTDELGKPGPENGRLEEISPIRRAEHIHVPVLLAHGTDDNIVDVSQSKKLASELRRRGVPCETFFRPFEGHGFFSFDDRVEFYHRVEAFLAANLGGASLTAAK